MRALRSSPVSGRMVHESVERQRNRVSDDMEQTIANNVASGGTVQVTAIISSTTTVPTDATRVRFSATVTGATANGSVTGNASGGGPSSSDLLTYTAGTTATGTLTEPVGINDLVAFHNNGTSGISLTLKVTGYSTEVRASDISPTGGTTGQVLTNTGGGAAWQDIPKSDGATVLNGSGAPDDSLGTNGDFYIDTTASVIYGP